MVFADVSKIAVSYTARFENPRPLYAVSEGLHAGGLKGGAVGSLAGAPVGLRLYGIDINMPVCQ